MLARRGAEGFVLVDEAGTMVMRTTPGFAGNHSLLVGAGLSLR